MSTYRVDIHKASGIVSSLLLQRFWDSLKLKNDFLSGFALGPTRS